jgi:anaerobic magnesium-protoporphyrin IX monomethyl ester cyclase
VKVLLTHSYFLRLDPKQSQKLRPYPPLATLYAAANLRARGYQVAVFDAMLADSPADFTAYFERHEPDIVVLYEDNFNFLSKMCLARMREAALTMAETAKAGGVPVAAAGSDVTDHPDIYLAGGVDFAVLGEGDHTVVELLEWLKDQPSGVRVRPDHIPGLAFAASSPEITGVQAAAPMADELLNQPATQSVELLRTPKRNNERHPDVFPFPARELIDMEQYRQLWQEHHGYFSLNLVSTRGCPFHCNWCAKPIWGQRYAMRSPADVAEELSQVKQVWHPDHIWFADDIFGLRPSWVSEFSREVATRDAAVPFTIQSRCDLMTPEAVAGLRAAGCHEVWLGAESGSQSVLDAMDKGISVEQIRTARQRLGDAGIRASFFVQFGYPGERWDDVLATVELVRDTLPDNIGVSVSYPLPGTRFHALVADQLRAKANWDESGDLDMMFKGTYTTPFYRQLHLVLHDDLSLHRRKAGLEDVPHPLLEAVSADEHERRVARAWATLEELEESCRNGDPTELCQIDHTPTAPDLSRPFN